MPQEERPGVLFDLAADPIVVLDEPSLLDAAVAKYRARLAEAFDGAEDPLAEPPSRYIFNEDEWSLALQLFPRLAIEHLGLAHEGVAPFAIESQPTTRYHGNVAAFMAEVRSRLAARRACDGVRREHRRTRTFRRHLPRVRNTLQPGRARGKRDRHAPGGGIERQQRAGHGARQGAR